MPAVDEIRGSIMSPPGFSLGPEAIERLHGSLRRIVVGDLGFSLPTDILFGAIRDVRLRVKKPIPVTISRDESGVVVSSSELEDFGCGANISEALDDFAKTISELYISLEENADRLGDDLKRQFAHLRDFIEVRPTNESSRVQPSRIQTEAEGAQRP